MARESRIILYEAELAAAEAVVDSRKGQLFAARLSEAELAGFQHATVQHLLQPAIAAAIAAEAEARKLEG